MCYGLRRLCHCSHELECFCHLINLPKKLFFGGAGGGGGSCEDDIGGAIIGARGMRGGGIGGTLVACIGWGAIGGGILKSAISLLFSTMSAIDTNSCASCSFCFSIDRSLDISSLLLSFSVLSRATLKILCISSIDCFNSVIASPISLRALGCDILSLRM